VKRETKRPSRKQEPTIFPPVKQYSFRAGPYIAPEVPDGTVLQDECYGEVTVAGLTKAPIRWPGFQHSLGLHEGLMPVLCGGLVRAVLEEQENAVAHYWSVTRYMVDKWKRALAGCEDSNAVFTALAVKRADPAFRKAHGYTN
jgi:hypothetical protein